MVLKPEQERVRTLLVDTITLLCRNGLSYKTEFNINALIGITLDKEDIFLVDIRETIKNAAAEQEAEAEAAAAKERTERSNSKSRKRRKNSSKGDGAETSESEAETEGSSSNPRKNKSNPPANSNEASSKEPPSKRMIKQEMFENAQTGEEEEEQSLLIVKPEPGYRQQLPCDTNNTDSRAQQANMFDNTVDSLPGPSSWDPGQQQMNFNPNTSLPMNVPTTSQGLQPQQTQQVLYPPADAVLPPKPDGSKRFRSYTSVFKLEVVEYAKTHSKEGTGRKFGVDPKRVRDWIKQQDQLKIAPASRKRLAGGGRTPMLLNLEEVVVKWITEQWSKRIRVSCKMIQEKARELYSSGKYNVGTESGPATFSASSGWVTRFMQRRGMRTKRPSHPKDNSGKCTRTSKKDVCEDDEVELISVKSARVSTDSQCFKTEVAATVSMDTTSTTEHHGGMSCAVVTGSLDFDAAQALIGTVHFPTGSIPDFPIQEDTLIPQSALKQEPP